MFFLFTGEIDTMLLQRGIMLNDVEDAPLDTM